MEFVICEIVFYKSELIKKGWRENYEALDFNFKTKG